ncbi:MAG: sigma-54-dependent Fis family transcriptional regulator, partial [Candidatus Rokuibacteriota bacterium]
MPPLLTELVGESPATVAVRAKLRQLLGHDREPRRRPPPVLLQGETGTGKGLLARLIHREGPRREGPFVDINCAAIPATLLEAELFGFERGAFTGAHHAKPGLFEAAHRGILFLDEIGLLPSALQPKLLKVIEEQAVRRLGSTRSEPVDVWILAASSQNLAAGTAACGFREDLYHRLAVMTVFLPPLRERREDIGPLADHLLARARADYGLSPRTLAVDARAALLSYGWPGNVRELSNVLERAALLTDGPMISVANLGLPTTAVTEPPSTDPAAPAALDFDDAVTSVECERSLDALRVTSWNVTRAAGRLGISRARLRYRIE